MGIYRTENPQEFAAVDGIVISETAPAQRIRGIGTGVAILVGNFDKGPVNQLTEPGSQQKIAEIFGTSGSGYKALVNKRFSRLKIIRTQESGGAKATLTLETAGNADVITFTAKAEGTEGNDIEVRAVEGSVGTTTYTIQRGSVIENYANVSDGGTKVEIEAEFENSQLVDVVSDSQVAPVHSNNFISLAGGADPASDDSDYQAAVKVAEAENSGNILFLDEYNETRNGYLKTHAGETQDKIVICAGAVDETVDEAITAVNNLRDTDGRIIYAYNWVQTNTGAGNEFVSPASFLASVLSQTSAHVDPAFAANSRFLYGISAIKNELLRSDFIKFQAAGICSFEFDPDIGYKVKSGVTTQIADSEKVTILRRRMADFLTNSVGRALKVFQNAPNTRANRLAAKAAIVDFIRQQTLLGVLPSNEEVQNGLAFLVDVDTPNTNSSVGDGFFYIDYRQRIFSSMRFIVFRAEIGTSVVVVEGGAE